LAASFVVKETIMFTRRPDDSYLDIEDFGSSEDHDVICPHPRLRIAQTATEILPVSTVKRGIGEPIVVHGVRDDEILHRGSTVDAGHREVSLLEQPDCYLGPDRMLDQSHCLLLEDKGVGRTLLRFKLAPQVLQHGLDLLRALL
jgi:hypothetical protein